MSDTQKENWKYLIGSVGSIALLLIGLWLRDYVDDQKETKAKIEMIYINSITQALRDSLQNVNIARVAFDLNEHQKETNNAIMQIQQSMLSSQKQLVDADKIIHTN